MNSRLFLIISLLSINLLSAQTTIIPTDNSQSNLRDAYRTVLQQAAHRYANDGTVDNWLALPGRPYYGEVPVYWSMDSTQFPGSVIIPDSVNTTGITAFETTFPALSSALSLNFDDSRVSIWVLKCRSTDTTNMITTWEDVYFEQFLVNVLNLQAGAHFQMVSSTELVQTVYQSRLFDQSPASAKILIIPAFVQGDTVTTKFMDQALQAEPQLAPALKYFLQSGGTLYSEGNAAYLLEAAAIIPVGTVDFSNTVDGVAPDMLAEITAVTGMLPSGYSNQLYTTQAPTLHDSLHVVAHFTTTQAAEDFYHDAGSGRHRQTRRCDL